jgi:hypothetical protein
MLWAHPLLTSTITYLTAHDFSLTPRGSFVEVLAAYRQMPCLQYVNFVQRAPFRPPGSAAEDFRLFYIDIGSLVVYLPFDDRTLLMPYSPDGYDIYPPSPLTLRTLKPAFERQRHSCGRICKSVRLHFLHA